MSADCAAIATAALMLAHAFWEETKILKLSHHETGLLEVAPVNSLQIANNGVHGNMAWWDQFSDLRGSTSKQHAKAPQGAEGPEMLVFGLTV